MKPLAALTQESARRIRVVATDLDDTVLDHGKLTPVAYSALCDLARAGIPVLVATGRPLGWAEVIARLWPVHAALAENGAAAAINIEGKTVRRFRDPLDPARMTALRDRLVSAFPDIPLTDDAHLRATDVTFDVAEPSPSGSGQLKVTPTGRLIGLSNIS